MQSMPRQWQGNDRVQVHEHEGDKYVLIREDRRTAVLWVLVALLGVTMALLGETRYRAYQNAETMKAYAYSINGKLSRIEGELNAERTQGD